MVDSHYFLPSLAVFDKFDTLRFASVSHKFHEGLFVDLAVGVPGGSGGVTDKQIVNLFEYILFVFLESF